MTSAATGEPVVKKKHVRFARMDEDDDDNEEQEEDTLFDKRKDVKRGLKSALKGGKGLANAGFDKVEIKRPGRSGTGSCGRWLVTLTLCASFLGLGMCISVLGPTLGDLASNVNKTISNISYIFAGRATGYIGGSLLGGLVFDLINPHLLLGLAMLGTALGMFATPFCKKALLLTVLVSSVGVSMGILDTGGNVLILDTWGDHAGPHMQALHFSFAVGAFVSPIIAKLLFGNEDLAASVTGPPLGHHNESKHVGMPPSFFHSGSGVLMSMWAYMVIGSFILLVSLFFFIHYSRSSTPVKQAVTSSGKQLFSKHHKVLVTLLSVFFFWYVGAEVAFGSFIFTYAKDFIGLEQVQAAGLNSLFWGSFAACRGLAIFFAACMYPGTLILASLVGSTMSSLLLVLFRHNQVALWSCTAVYGASMAATFPSGISWLEQYTVLTGRSAAVFVVGAALGEMVLPAVLGFLLGRVHDHPVLMYLCLGTATITSILFPVMYKLASPGGGTTVRKSRARGLREADDSEYRQALLDSADNEEAEPEEGGESEADQWNDADFEVIEMDDTSLVNSPSKVSSSPPNALSCSQTAPPSSTPAPETSVLSTVANSTSVLGESPRRKLLLALNREKKD